MRLRSGGATVGEVIDLSTPDPDDQARRRRSGWHILVAMLMAAVIGAAVTFVAVRHAQAAIPPSAPTPATRSVVTIVDGVAADPFEVPVGSVVRIEVHGNSGGNPSCEIDIDGKRATALADIGPKSVVVCRIVVS